MTHQEFLNWCEERRSQQGQKLSTHIELVDHEVDWIIAVDAYKTSSNKMLPTTRQSRKS